ncbi:hypothetical protein [Escherichia coli]|uniref:hypothetical protein n=1 Tax=Escherichia coli TaxID=562 RepID=UPI00388EDC5F
MQQLSFLPGEMTPGERSLILRALKTLDRHLHEPGVAFTSQPHGGTGMADSEPGGTGAGRVPGTVSEQPESADCR